MNSVGSASRGKELGALDRLAQAGVHRPSSGGRRLAAPYPRFSAHQPLRLAFVGQKTYFDQCTLRSLARGIEPTFIDFRAGSDANLMLEALGRCLPHVVIVFRPEIVPAGAFAGLTAVTLGYLTEPLPRLDAVGHPDLERRLHYLGALDPDNFDRIVSFDPLIAATVDRIVPVWRSLPLPVADEFFAEVNATGQPPRILFAGRSTAHRELFLTSVKHEFDVVHVAHGLSGERLRDALAETDIGINLHNEAYPTFENRCAFHLAAGNLLITEALSPTHGLEPGIDYIEVGLPQELHRVLFNARRNPLAYQRIRIRGRRKAEYFRASRVYPALVSDLLLDVHTFGSARGHA